MRHVIATDANFEYRALTMTPTRLGAASRPRRAARSSAQALSAPRVLGVHAAAVRRHQAVRPRRATAPRPPRASDDAALDVTEYEQAHELEPGLAPDRRAPRSRELGKLVARRSRTRSRSTLLDGNPAWPDELADGGARRRARATRRSSSCCRSRCRARRTTRATCAGRCSARATTARRAPFWRELRRRATRERFARLVAWARARTGPRAASRVLADADELPARFARALGSPATAARRRRARSSRSVPFATLPAARPRARTSTARSRSSRARRASSSSSTRATASSRASCRARRRSRSCTCSRASRAAARSASRSRAGSTSDDPAQHARTATASCSHVARTHRWQRVARDDRRRTATATLHRQGLGRAVLDRRPTTSASTASRWRATRRSGPRTTSSSSTGRAPRRARSRAPRPPSMRGGRFGYRFYYPPMRAGERELFWHLPLVARLRATAPRRRDAATVRRCSATSPPRRQPRTPTPADRARAAAPRPPGHREAARRCSARAGARAPHDDATTCASCSSSASCSATPLPPVVRARAAPRRQGTIARRLARRRWPAGGVGDATAARALAAPRSARASSDADEPTPSRRRSRSTARARARSRSSSGRRSPRSPRASSARRRTPTASPSTAASTGGPAAKAARARAGASAAISSARRSPARALPRAHRDARHDRPRRRCVDHAFRWETDFDVPLVGGLGRRTSRARRTSATSCS